MRRALPLTMPDGRPGAPELHITLRYPHFPPAVLPTALPPFRLALTVLADRWRAKAGRGNSQFS